MRSVEEQLALVLAAARPLPAGAGTVADSLGRTLAVPVRAAVDIPVFDNSAMDGFAVRGADVAGASPDSPVRLRVVAEVPAGSALDPALAPGEAARIMTGAPVPTAADAIVPVEDTVDGFAGPADETVVLRAPRPGAHVRRAGEDARAGDEVVPAGIVLGPLQAGAIAASAVVEVTTARAPRVAVVSTGSELVAPGEPLGRGAIPESNGALLAALVAEAGGEVVLRTSVPDDPAALRRVLEQAGDVDAVVMSGGVSAGAYEPVKQAFGAGGGMEFASVAMQPGKPQGFGVAPGGALMFGLPGNPVSVAVSFEVFVRPALLALQGRAELHRPRIALPAAEGWRTPPGRRQYLPAAIDRSDPARWTVRPATAGGSKSHLAGALARAEAYAVVPAEVEEVGPGDLVEVWLRS